MVLGILVHDPGHHFGVGAHVGGRDVAVGPDDVVNFVDEFARDPLDFAQAEPAGIDGDPAFRAAVGDIDDGRFPGHQGRQSANFVEIDFRMIAQPPFHRPARIVVLHAIADERGQLAVVHLNGDLHLHFAFRDDEQPPHVLGQIHLIRRAIEVELQRVECSHGDRLEA